VKFHALPRLETEEVAKCARGRGEAHHAPSLEARAVRQGR
jgi:hypothetical protein